MITQHGSQLIDTTTGEVLTPSQVALHFVLIENRETLQQLAVYKAELSALMLKARELLPDIEVYEKLVAHHETYASELDTQIRDMALTVAQETDSTSLLGGVISIATTQTETFNEVAAVDYAIELGLTDLLSVKKSKFNAYAKKHAVPAEIQSFTPAKQVRVMSAKSLHYNEDQS